MHIRWRGMELPSTVEVDRESLTATYGKFTAEPFERGFGHTLDVPIGMGSGICANIAVRDGLGRNTKIVGVVADVPQRSVRQPAEPLKETCRQSESSCGRSRCNGRGDELVGICQRLHVAFVQLRPLAQFADLAKGALLPGLHHPLRALLAQPLYQS